MAGYTSAADIQWGKDTINENHKYFSGLRNWEWTNNVFTSTTTADQSTIKLPVDYRRLIRFTLTVSGINYTPEEVPNSIIFDRIRANTPNTTSDFPTHFHIRGKEILVYPTIASAGNTANVEYQLRPVDMTADDHITGTVSDITNGDTAVEGTGTPLWTAAMAGRYLQITADGQWYRIASVTDADTLVLDIPYEGTSVAAGTEAYRISELPVIPEDYQKLLWLQAISEWYMSKSDEDRAEKYDRWTQRLLSDMKKKYAYSSHINVFRGAGEPRVINPNFNPAAITLT